MDTTTAPSRYAKALDGIEMPPQIQRLPIDPERRMPVPWFCVQDPIDFRVIRRRGFELAHTKRLCWICGTPRYEKRLAFVVGPMCVVTGTNSEPPAHPACARFAALACPFLANPRARRNDKELPEDHQQAAGNPIPRNPGVAAVLHTDRYKLFGDGMGGVLVEMGKPSSVDWYREGRPATRDEVQHSVTTGLPILSQDATRDGVEAVLDLQRRLHAFMPWMPAA